MRQIVFEPYLPLSLWLLLAVAASAALGRYLFVLRSRLQPARWRAVAVLMVLAIVLPLLMLLNPTWLERMPPPPGKPHLTILVDQSASMAAGGDESGHSRWELAVKAAATTAEQLDDRYEIRIRTFADQTKPMSVAELSGGSPDGQHTDLARAITEVLDAASPQGQAVLLLSDGIHNAAGGTAEVRRALAAADATATPVYTVTVGGQHEVDDLAVELSRPRELAFVGQKVPVSARVIRRGKAADTGKLQMWRDDTLVDEQDLSLNADGRAEQVFHVTEASKGLYRYEFRLPPLPNEATDANNHATLLLRVVEEPVRMLLLEGKPYWDTKFLMRTLSRDPSVELTGVVRLTEDRLLQRKFTRLPANEVDVAANANEGTAIASQFDEQVSYLTSAAELLGDPEALKGYQIVVLGRDAEVFLTEDAMDGLEKWVKEDEGSLVCFRGPPAAQINERLARMMPVNWTPTQETRYRVAMTEAGEHLRWLDQAADAPDLTQMPTVAAMARAEVRSMAEILAASEGDKPEAAVPMISYVRIGMGRVVAVEGAGMWRWAFLPPKMQDRDQVYQQLWTGLVRWLACSAQLLPSQNAAFSVAKTTFGSTETVAADLIVRPEALKEGTPTVRVTEIERSETLKAETLPSGSYPGQFRVVFGQLPEGRYRAEAHLPGQTVAVAQTAFDVRHGNLREVLELTARGDLMRTVADESGGEVLDSFEPQQLADKFEAHLARSRPDRIVRREAWDRPWVLLLVLGLWATAWGLRRQSGLV